MLDQALCEYRRLLIHRLDQLFLDWSSMEEGLDNLDSANAYGLKQDWRWRVQVQGWDLQSKIAIQIRKTLYELVPPKLIPWIQRYLDPEGTLLWYGAHDWLMPIFRYVFLGISWGEIASGGQKLLAGNMALLLYEQEGDHPAIHPHSF